MRYVSTRRNTTSNANQNNNSNPPNNNNDDGISVTFEEALISGYAPDGGLWVPTNIPKIDTTNRMKVLSKCTFPQLAFEILSMFIDQDEIPSKDLEDLLMEAFGEWDDADIIPIKKLHKNVFISELFHGPTQCFKDLAMKVVISLLSYFATKHKRRTTLLVATTGDTGPAAVHAVAAQKSSSWLKILVHYPLGQISEFQRKQLTTVQSSENVKIVAFDGGGDDMDLPIKRILTSSSGHDDKDECLCGVNSYNIGRPLAQMVHFIWTYFRVMEQLEVTPGDPDIKLDIVLPTGAMGNIVGGYMAKLMGIPIGLLCSGVNENDITHRVIQTGKFYKSLEMERTLSEAINIQVPYNFERILYYLTSQDPSLTRQWMSIMDQPPHQLDLPPEWHEKLSTQFRSARVTDAQMCQTMRDMMKECNGGYLADPHTSVAICAAVQLGYLTLDDDNDDDGGNAQASFQKKNKQDTIKTEQSIVAILATASPCKFQQSITVALGKHGWDEYFHENFPDTARDIMTREEVPPVIYHWDKKLVSSLEKIQYEWEGRTRDIIDGFWK